MTKSKSIMLWVLAFILMASLAIYQRVTGPTYAVTGTVEINGAEIDYELPRSHGGDGGELISIAAKDFSISGTIKYKRYKSHDEWQTVELARNGDVLEFEIPHQPAAGKVIYDITLSSGTDSYKLSERPEIIRFKGAVPDGFLIPHVFFMFLAMCFSMRTGFEVLFKGNSVYKLTMWTTILLFAGGIILGPIIQLYAFGDLWTGWPLGEGGIFDFGDLTDNKTIVAFAAWIVALIVMKLKPEKTGWALLASIILLAVYLIPHSALGSEIDYTKVQQ